MKSKLSNRGYTLLVTLLEQRRESGAPLWRFKERLIAVYSERNGFLLALLGFATLSIGDGVIKTMAGEWPAGAVGALRFALGAIGLSLLLLLREGAGAFRPLFAWINIARGACLGLATLGFVSAIFVMPLAETMAITFVSPVLTAILSGPILGEKVRPAVWLASLTALTGVVMILRPNLAELGWQAVLPLVSALFFSLMIILNRAAAGRGSALSMQVSIAVPAALVLIVASAIGDQSGVEQLAVTWPGADIILRCLLVALTASTAHWLIFQGTMRAGAAHIAPASYVQMLVASAIGWIWFKNVPDLMTILGAIIIIGSGLYLWHQGKSNDRLKPVA